MRLGLATSNLRDTLRWEGKVKPGTSHVWQACHLPIAYDGRRGNETKGAGRSTQGDPGSRGATGELPGSGAHAGPHPTLWGLERCSCLLHCPNQEGATPGRGCRAGAAPLAPHRCTHAHEGPRSPRTIFNPPSAQLRRRHLCRQTHPKAPSALLATTTHVSLARLGPTGRGADPAPTPSPAWPELRGRLRPARRPSPGPARSPPKRPRHPPQPGSRADAAKALFVELKNHYRRTRQVMKDVFLGEMLNTLLLPRGASTRVSK